MCAGRRRVSSGAHRPCTRRALPLRTPSRRPHPHCAPEQVFKPYLEDFLGPLFHSLACGHRLCEAAAGRCIGALRDLIGEATAAPPGCAARPSACGTFKKPSGRQNAWGVAAALLPAGPLTAPPDAGTCKHYHSDRAQLPCACRSACAISLPRLRSRTCAPLSARRPRHLCGAAVRRAAAAHGEQPRCAAAGGALCGAGQPGHAAVCADRTALMSCADLMPACSCGDSRTASWEPSAGVRCSRVRCGSRQPATGFRAHATTPLLLVLQQGSRQA